MVVVTSGSCVSACVRLAKRALGKPGALEVCRSSEEGGLHRVSLDTGDEVEVTVVLRQRCRVEGQFN